MDIVHIVLSFEHATCVAIIPHYTSSHIYYGIAVYLYDSYIIK